MRDPPPKELCRAHPGSHLPDFVVFFFTGLKVISIIKRLIKKKRGECVTLEGEHYFQTNDTFVWKKRETTTMVSGDRIRISGDRGKTVEIRRLEESDTAMYSAMIHTAGGLEITRHWLVVRGRYFTFSSPEPTILLACGREREGSLACSNTGSPRFTDFPSNLTNLIG